MIKYITYSLSHAVAHTKTMPVSVGCKIISLSFAQHAEANQNCGLIISMDYQCTSITDLTNPDKILWKYSQYFAGPCYAWTECFGVKCASGNLYLYFDFDNTTDVYVTICYEVG